MIYINDFINETSAHRFKMIVQCKGYEVTSYAIEKNKENIYTISIESREEKP